MFTLYRIELGEDKLCEFTRQYFLFDFFSKMVTRDTQYLAKEFPFFILEFFIIKAIRES